MSRLFQTTIAGSLPKPAWLAEPNALWAPWKLEGELLAQGKRDAVRLALFDQEHAGIDIVTDGEQTRRHFVTTFIEGLDGVDFANKKTVRIRNRYDADVPMVVGPVARRHPIYVDDARFVRGETQRKVKYTLPGPMTMVDTLYDTHYKSREKLAFAFAEILNEEARAIEAAGRGHHPVRRAGLQRLLRGGPRLGRPGAGAGGGRPAMHHGGAYLLRIRDQGQQRLEADAGQRMAPVRADLSPAGGLRDRPGVARMREFPGADRTDRPPAGKGRPGRARSTSPATGSRRPRTWPRRSGRRPSTCRPSGSSPVPTAGWCRCRGTWPAASCTRWPPAPRWPGASLPGCRGPERPGTRVFPNCGSSRTLPKVFCFKY